MLDSTMSLVITGNTLMGSVDFDPGPGTAMSAPTSNFVAKYALNGTLKFVRFYEDSIRISCLARLSGDRILIALGLNATVDMDPGPGVEIFTPYPNTELPFFGHDVLFSLLDSSGIFIYAKKFGGYYTERPLKILVDEFDNFYIAGHFTDSILTDPNISMQGINSVGNQDAFIAYFDQNGKNQFILPLESMGTDYYINNLLLDKNYHLIISGGYEGYTDFDLGINVAQDFLQDTVIFMHPDTD
ncbi:MAG: hypothetical protein IPP71_00030 [Bacteroidetes bacterium]|nr:hypothetical protein [Bacteroidota bacterium]